MKRVLYPLLVLAMSVPCVADSLVYMRVPKPLIEEHIKQAKDVEAERVSTLRNLFQKDGCAQVVEQPVPEEQSPNLICILPGIAEGTILVSASLDYATEDAKTPAYWSALALLPLLAKSLAGVPHRSTLMLIAFPGRGHGMRGLAQYVSQLTEAQRKTLRAAVDLDNLGRTPAIYALAQPDKTLSTWLLEAARSLHLAAPPMVEAKSKDEDLAGNTQLFVQAHIPAISLQSAQPSMLATLKHDGALPDSVTGDGFSLDTFDDTYRLLCIYVLYLDGNLGRPPIKLGTYAGTLLDTVGLFGSRTIDFSAELGRFTTVAELMRFKAILKKDGQDALADALEKSNDVGSYRVALRLGTGLKMAVLQTSGKTPSVFLVAVRLKRSGHEDSLHDYRFDVIQLNVDGKGDGDASYYDSAKLRFNSKDELEIEDRRYMPDEVRQVHLQQPPAKIPPPIKFGTYTGTLLDTAGVFGPRTSEISMTVDRFTTAAELENLEATLKKGGQEALIDTLENAGDAGSYRVDLRLGTGAKLAVLQTSGKTPSVLLVAVRPRIRTANPVNDYRFEVVHLTVDAKGDGDGILFDKCKLRFNSQHELEIADHLSPPDEIRKVHLQAPEAPKTPPKAN